MRPLVASIDFTALKSNFELARSLAPASKNFAVIKADAYGHGAIQCAKVLNQADGFAVATVEEAVELREAAIKKPILILSTFSQAEEVEIMAELRLMPVLHSTYQLDLIKKHHSGTEPVRCWIKIDTGMNRLGFDPDEFLSVLQKIETTQAINLVGVLSHFASSDESTNTFTHKQLQKFLSITSTLNLPLSIANSSAILAWPNTHLDWNRPGIMLYGTSTIDCKSEYVQRLKPVMNFTSQLIAVKGLKKHQPVGYGETFVAQSDMKVGVVACGYADGYPRNTGTDTPILVNGQKSRILGRVSMDTLSVDLTDIAHPQVGDEVVLWGNGLPVEQIASVAQTIPYELLVNVSKRVPRKYKS